MVATYLPYVQFFFFAVSQKIANTEFFCYQTYVGQYTLRQKATAFVRLYYAKN